MKLALILAAVFTVLGTASSMAVPNPNIKHIVVLMLENRSFDHMLGYLKLTDNPNIDGLTGQEYNYLNVSDPNSPKVYADHFAKYVDPDPNHSVPATTEQVFGDGPQDVPVAPMDGFAMNAEHNGIPGQTVMSAFEKDAVPVISTLATEFAIFDHWHASVPGPTQVNRMYLLSGTSDGSAFNDDKRIAEGYPQKSIFKHLHDNGIDWNVYYEEVPGALLFLDMRTPEALARFHTVDNFERHVKDKTLPTFSFLEPKYFQTDDIAANDQHPSHDVVEGEKLMKRIYETLRNSEIWNNTLFIITYDEHGGFYDHYPTPLKNVPNPDGKVSTSPPFNFDRLGVRVPCVMISPWIPKGTLVHDGVNGTYFEHSSVSATLKRWFNLDSFLTKRDAWAASFEGITSLLDEPRTDCPATLPDPPASFREQPLTGDGPVSDLQREFVHMAALLHGITDEYGDSMTENQAGKFVKEMMESYMENIRSQKN